MIASRLALLAAVVGLASLATAVPASAACTSSSPTVTTGQSRYGTFDIVTISGCGFGYREPVSVLVTAPDGSSRSGDGLGTPGPEARSADENGAFELTYRFSGSLPSGGTYSGPYGDYSVAVTSPSGFRLAETSFIRVRDTNATCAVTTSGRLRCWGSNALGQLGTGSGAAGSAAPVPVGGLGAGVAQMSVGLRHACAVSTQGGVACWGAGDHGALGDGTSRSSATPVHVSGLEGGIAQVTAGGSHTCALTTGGGVLCWGNGTSGALGDGTLRDSSTPVKVIGLETGVAQISAGASHTCALMTSGAVKCWGLGTDGRLGTGSESNSPTPVDVNGLTSGVSQISAGDSHTCAVRETGGAACWGNGTSGALGHGAFTSSAGPVELTGLPGAVTQISAGGDHTCAVLAGGGLSCWGGNDAGQLGSGGYSSSATPVSVSGLTSGVAQVRSGANHTCALTRAGRVSCWGDGRSGLLGPDALAQSAIPVAIGGLAGNAALLSDIFDGQSATRAGNTQEPVAMVAPAANASAGGFLGKADVLAATYSRASDPDFLWLPPTVPTAPPVTGPFDPTALNALVIEVCELDAAGACVYRAPVARITSATRPVSRRLTLDETNEFYSVDWPTPSSLRLNRLYRLRVLKGDTELGSLELDVVRFPAELAAVDTSRHLGVVRGQPLTIRFRLQHPTARTRVRINEIESNGGIPGDWIELHNSAPVPVSLAGYIIKDNDDTHVYVLPEGAVIPANGYYLAEDALLGFGLGAADMVRLFTPDGSVVTDSYAWASHAVTTYGRCPNGIGEFQATTTVTKGVANDCRIVIRINEVESSGGAPGDWVELYNPGPGPANLRGFVFSDNDNTHRYALPAVVVPSGGYLVLDESVFGFGLGGADAARLFGPSGALVDSYTWVAHAATTYGRCPDGNGPFGATFGPTKGTTNSCSAPVTTVHINEVESNGGVPGDWIELHNNGLTPVDLSGWLVRDNDDTRNAVLPPGSVIAPGGYLIVEEALLGFGLGAADAARLYDTFGALYESYSWTAHATTSYGRCPNATGAFVTTSSVTKGAANDCSSPVRINEVESSGGVPGDWIELYNPSGTAANVSGFVVRDNDDTHTYVIPGATSIPAGGYYLVEEAVLGFGLGGADSARLFDAGGALVDSYAWAVAAPTTYGRCPNGIGAFAATGAPTKGAANDCAVAPIATVHINEVESSGGVPGDWFELVNTGASSVNLTGWRMLDNDDTHVAYVLPAGTTIAAGGYLVVEEAAIGFGLGAADSVRLFDATGALYESYSWPSHATTTYGRCPSGTGAFTTTTSVTKGAANDCGSPVKINEVETSGGVPGDWVELYNPGGSAVDISGFVFRDNDDTHTYTVPAGTSIPAGGYYLLEEAAFVFGLGGSDSARLFDTTGALLDSYTWTLAAATTYGRCPNGNGAFTTTTAATKGVVNSCPGEQVFLPWPGEAAVQTADGLNVFGGNMSGLVYEGSGNATPGVLWGARNGPGSLFRLVWDGANFTPDTDNGWSAGKGLRYPGDVGSPDAEGVTFADAGSIGGMYVATERDNNANGISRNSILRFDVGVPGATLTASDEWNLTADLPAVGPNLGMEAITWIPDAFLVAKGFFDESKSHVYNPAEYPNHGTGLFFIGLEANGMVYVYALDHTLGGGFTRVATIASGFIGVMDLHFDRETNDLWAVCDDTCLGRSAVLRIDALTGKFVVARTFDRPATMPNLNNEGFAIAPLAECVADRRPAFWADDSETGGHAIRRGTVSCVPVP